ncbi:2OG-Fe dioxygenase family protein [Ideonella sp. 4Y16]|uniref:2OG-Fe dioxygenase family protein n=1 Tax=Ideonella alba TaxID=2824118 RepID=A0A941BMD0_9BURK|nr:2OG-Fe dioxygenase family protein [Ideonella alba]MBQ0932134.1 2OG-Fe dioxygenase family protein [Ideonella alba]MBQ0943640.1 2OG-Fe dioxygenase family protein [Ideonella alba]
MMLQPPVTPAPQIDATLAAQGFGVLDADGAGHLLGCPSTALDAWLPFWDRLPPDRYLKDGGRYRYRRHGCFIVEGEQLTLAPHRPHWQPVEYNALHGGIERHFEPIEPALLAHPLWNRWLVAMAARASALKGARRWYVEAHPFRIDTTDGIGRPTPEGAHRDGVDLVTVTLVARQGIKGAETRVFAAQGREGQRFTLSQPWSTLLLDDERVIHESTPIQPAEPGGHGHRDTLVLTFRANGFQGP